MRRTEDLEDHCGQKAHRIYREPKTVHEVRQEFSVAGTILVSVSLLTFAKDLYPPSPVLKDNGDHLRSSATLVNLTFL